MAKGCDPKATTCAPAAGTTETAPAASPLPTDFSDPLVMQEAGGGGNAAVVEAMRRMPAGANIFQIEANPEPLVSTFDALWKEAASGDRVAKGGPNAPSDGFSRTDAADELRDVLSTSALSASSRWSSGWRDDGVNDMWNLGVMDVNFKADVDFWLRDGRVLQSGNGGFSASAGSSSGRASGSEMGGALGGTHSGVTAGVNGKQTQSATFAATGGNGLSMGLPAQAVESTLVGIATLTLADPLAGAAPSVTAEVDVGRIVTGEIAL